MPVLTSVLFLFFVLIFLLVRSRIPAGVSLFVSLARSKLLFLSPSSVPVCPALDYDHSSGGLTCCIDMSHGAINLCSQVLHFSTKRHSWLLTLDLHAPSFRRDRLPPGIGSTLRDTFCDANPLAIPPTTIIISASLR